MPTSRSDRNPEGPERRRAYRREEDDEVHEIVEHAVHDAPIVNRLLKSGRLGTTMLGIGVLLGGATPTVATRVLDHEPKPDLSAVNLRVDTNAARITRLQVRFDSVLTVLGNVSKDVETSAFIQCIQLRRDNPDLRPKGCDETEKRGARRP